MKRIGLILTTILIFAVSLYVAYMQGVNYVDVNGSAGVHLAAPLNGSIASLSVIGMKFLSYFSNVVSALARVFGGSLIVAVVVLALLVQLITLYPAVNLQLKQKKVHMFHKKLVNRFQRGELTMSAGKRELDVLYSVNERIHRRGALLVATQLVVFLIVFVGLSLMSYVPSVLFGSFSSFNYALLSAPVGYGLSIMVSLAYLLHALSKIHFKQREDYIDARQIYVGLGIALVIAAMVFYFASTLPVLLTVFFLTLVTFSTMRYVVVEVNSKKWGKFVQKELIKLLHTAKAHKNKVQHWTRKFHHIPIIRYLNFHLLEEGASMSLAIIMVINGVMLH